jgi:phosphoribosylamine---glycine ligase
MANTAKDYKVLIVGGGGREHALAWKCAQSPRVTEVLVAPGNAGTARELKVRNVPIAVEQLTALADLAEAEGVALTIIGPEVPLVAGIVDVFQQRGLACFGPRKAPAQLEGSKVFTKEFLQRHGIPTAGYRKFTRANFDATWLAAQPTPLVIKASGLAAGKGVVIAETSAEAVAAAQSMLNGRFGVAGDEIVVEEFLVGEEASFIVMSDGKHVLPMASSQDHKRLGDGDQGPNTGGMGAYSPAPVVTPAVHERIMREVIEPTIQGLAADGMPFVGFLYAGLMIDPGGAPRVIEFNVRFGDPETQPVIARLKSDLTVLCEAALAGELQHAKAEWDPRAALGVVIAAHGYPDEVRKGDVIHGLDHLGALPGKLFHAGTTANAGKVVTAGGRVFCAVGLGVTVRAAQRDAYAIVDAVQFAGAQARRDIGYRAIARESGG